VILGICFDLRHLGPDMMIESLCVKGCSGFMMIVGVKDGNPWVNREWGFV